LSGYLILEYRRKLWDIPIVKAATLDDRRRLVMPEECPPNSTVTISQVDKDTWIVKRHSDRKNFKVVLIPVVDKLPDDPAWEKVEKAFAESAYRKLPPPKE